jgi:hypothetical protein
MLALTGNNFASLQMGERGPKCSVSMGLPFPPGHTEEAPFFGWVRGRLPYGTRKGPSAEESHQGVRKCELSLGQDWALDVALRHTGARTEP